MAARSILLAVLAAGAAAPASARQHLVFTLEGDPGDGLGSDLAVVGDLDQDGFPEIAAGISTGLKIVSGRTGRPLLEFAVGGLVKDLEALGDTNGDGFGDLAIGRTSSIPSQITGGLDIISGAWLAWLAKPVGAPPLAAFFSSTLIGVALGEAVSVVGDITGDGVPELAVAVLVDSSNGGALIHDGHDFSHLIFYPHLLGPLPNDAEIEGVGDVDSDLVPDVALGDTSALGGRGTVAVVSAAAPALSWRVSGATTGEDRFGSALAVLDDLDGDGANEIAIGATQISATTGQAFGPGYVSVRSGATGTSLYHVEGDANGDRFGHALVSLPDLDGDGKRELAVGAPQGSPDAGYVRVLSGASGAALRTIAAPPSSPGFGSSLCADGDIDSDGTLDLAVGAPLANGGRGRLFVFSTAARPVPAHD